MGKAKTEFLKRSRKAYFKIRGLKYVDIAREMNLSVRTISTVMNRFPEKKSRAIQKYIADRLCVPYEKLWGVDPHHNKTILTKEKRVVND
jgi:lambda repressor-like predicted transcriptional regulator